METGRCHGNGTDRGDEGVGEVGSGPDTRSFKCSIRASVLESATACGQPLNLSIASNSRKMERQVPAYISQVVDCKLPIQVGKRDPASE